MRIVHVGHWDSQWETENDWQAAFEALGHDVTPLEIRRAGYGDIRSAALTADLLLWSGGCQPVQPLAETITTLWMLADRGIPTATLHLDPWWGLDRGGCPWWLNPMFQTGTIFTASGDNQDKWDHWGKHHIWLPPAVRHTVPDKPGVRRPEWICDVALVGSNGRGYHGNQWPHRRLLHDALAAMCERHSWTFLNPGGDQPRISREWMTDFYASATVTVGDSLCPYREKSLYWSDRTPEATGRRGLLVMPHIDALTELYPAMPTYPWGEWAALENTVERLLGDPQERNRIVAECHQVTATGHTYLHRAATVLDTLDRGRRQ